MKCCINEQRPDQKSEQTPMTRDSQADLVGGCLTENHAKDRSRGYKLKECDRCEGAGDDQNEFDVFTDHCCRRAGCISPIVADGVRPTHSVATRALYLRTIATDQSGQ